MEEHYLAVWEMDIWADSPEEAAIKALDIQRDPRSSATVFQVRNVKTGQESVIDVETL